LLIKLIIHIIIIIIKHYKMSKKEYLVKKDMSSFKNE